MSPTPRTAADWAIDHRGSVTDVAVSGVLATLANGANVAAQLDVTTPLTPVTKRCSTGLVRAMRMAARRADLRGRR